MHVACALQNQPAELFQDFTTIEYAVPSAKPIQPPAYVFVVDTCVAEDELRACIASLSQALTTLPEYAQVTAFPLSHKQRRHAMRSQVLDHSHVACPASSSAFAFPCPVKEQTVPLPCPCARYLACRPSKRLHVCAGGRGRPCNSKQLH